MPLQGVKEARKIVIRQQKELSELFGFETRNKYSIELPTKAQIGFAAEQGKGISRFFLRQFFGHWRAFKVKIFDSRRNEVLLADHPFRVVFQRLELMTPEGRILGIIKKRFSLLTKSFDVIDPSGRLLFEVRSPIWRIWTFSFKRLNREMAVVKKKWTGFLKETFTDADNFEVDYTQGGLTEDEKVLIMVSGIYIDLMFFEKKAGSS